MILFSVSCQIIGLVDALVDAPIAYSYAAIHSTQNEEWAPCRCNSSAGALKRRRLFEFELFVQNSCLAFSPALTHFSHVKSLAMLQFKAACCNLQFKAETFDNFQMLKKRSMRAFAWLLASSFARDLESEVRGAAVCAQPGINLTIRCAQHLDRTWAPSRAYTCGTHSGYPADTLCSS